MTLKVNDEIYLTDYDFEKDKIVFSLVGSSLKKDVIEQIPTSIGNQFKTYLIVDLRKKEMYLGVCVFFERINPLTNKYSETFKMKIEDDKKLDLYFKILEILKFELEKS